MSEKAQRAKALFLEGYNCAQAVEARAAEYCDRLAFWKVHEQDYAESIPAWLK